MKAVIVALNGMRAAALCDDGCVRRLRNRRYEMGQVIELGAVLHGVPGPVQRPLLAAAVVSLLLLPTFFYYAPSSYVSLDVSPSVQLTLNRFERVVDCTAFNAGGRQLLAGLRLRHKSAREAITMTVQALAEENYLTAEARTDMLIAASCADPDHAASLADGLADAARQASAEARVEVRVETRAVCGTQMEQARALRISPGRLCLIHGLGHSPNDAPEAVDAWRDKPICDLMEESRRGHGRCTWN